MVSVDTAAREATNVAGGTAYPLANVLEPGPNISMRTTPQQRLYAILMCIAAGIGLGTFVWVLILIGANLSAR